MDWPHLVAFNATLLAALVSPGPAMLVALRATLLGGRAQGITTGFGLAIMAALWTGMALLGLDVIFALFPWAYTTAKVVGATYLIWLAIKMWRTAHQTLETVGDVVSRNRAFMAGFYANVANPKSMLFAASVLVVIFPPDMTLGNKLFIVLNQIVVEIVAYTAFAIALSTPPARAGYLALKPVLDRCAALILGVLGLRLMLTK
ncbi:LysE family translocator [Octadecabacter ascidiaceicola]|uniref:Threonine efflux protein n=1 Tax=Octadecabacter ascidiaceicola TaxID=1655543 RepID=A0A238JP04_9RHOB|nr:LysE family transporter [Octadecabacter ascidiaceicola]SMX31506.1 Threonine efflux protein [Octadecabacter ascidiaceicola]